MAKPLASKKKDPSRAAPDQRVLERFAALEAFDRGYADRGLGVIAGVDEAGRGALAGPVVSAAVVLPPGSELHGVFDSKQIGEKEREALFAVVVSRAVAVGIAFAHPDVIDRENILVATLMTMHRAVEGLRVKPDLVLVDGRETFQWRGMLVPVEKGDATSLCIAAASIVAKVARDRAMRRLHKRFPSYDFERNKGYGTAEHIAAITAHGTAAVHRRSFVGKIVEKNLPMF